MQLARKLVSSRGGARAAILATTAFGLEIELATYYICSARIVF